MNFYDLIISPFVEFDFMRYALASIVFLALSAAPVGVFLVMRRMSLVGDALSHAVLPGAAVGYMAAGLSLPAMSIGGFAAGMLMALLAGLVSRFTSLKEDANFAAFYLSSLAIGVVLVSKNGDSVDLLHLLFGSVLAVDVPALQLVAAVASLTVTALAVIYRPLMLESIDPLFLRAVNGRGGVWHVSGAGGDESGGGFSGTRHADVGRPDDAAGDYRAALGEEHGRADAGLAGLRLGVRSGRAAVFLPCRDSFRSGDYFVVRRAVSVFRGVRQRGRDAHQMAQAQETPHGLTVRNVREIRTQGSHPPPNPLSSEYRFSDGLSASGPFERIRTYR